jgi:diaminopimelate epimerase
MRFDAYRVINASALLNRLGQVRFEKWQALGNDYLIVEADRLPWELNAARVQRLCDPHFGASADGVLLLSRSDDPGFVARLQIFNPDGSEAELSGNGAREAILYLRRHGWTDADTFSIETLAGAITPTITSERTCSVQMGRAATASKDFPSGSADGRGTLSAAGRDWAFQHVSIGNPQCAIEVGEELEGLDLTMLGPEVEGHELFPNRTNVSFLRIDGSRVRARIFERGVGETLSSGTGASGAAVAAFLHGAESPIVVELDGGELEVEISDELDVRLSGWAEPICSGELSAELLAALAALDE